MSPTGLTRVPLPCVFQSLCDPSEGNIIMIKLLGNNNNNNNNNQTETVPIIVGVLGLLKKGVDQNLGKIPGTININELQKMILLGSACMII